jgi:hypothetical protein
MKPLNPLLFIPETTLTHGSLKSDPRSLLYILPIAIGVGIFRGALKKRPIIIRINRNIKQD